MFVIPPTAPKARIGILGGSFDPPHLGHQLLALSALATTPIDSLWVIPCASHAFQKALSSFEDRKTMCELAFSHLKNTYVLDIESKLAAPNYTIHTIEAISSLRPDLELSLIMGSDLLEHFDTWQGAQQIRELCTLSAFNRNSLLPEAQSTRIRKAIPMGNLEHLDTRVSNYIQAMSLYT